MVNESRSNNHKARIYDIKVRDNYEKTGSPEKEVF